MPSVQDKLGTILQQSAVSQLTIQVHSKQESDSTDPSIYAASRRAAASAEEFMLSGAIPPSLRCLLLVLQFLGSIEEWQIGNGKTQDDIDERRSTSLVQRD